MWEKTQTVWKLPTMFPAIFFSRFRFITCALVTVSEILKCNTVEETHVIGKVGNYKHSLCNNMIIIFQLS